MQGKGLREEILSDTAHHYRIGSEELVPVDEGRTIEGYWVVPLCHDEHTDESLVTVDNKVSSELCHVFLLLNELYLV